MTARHLPLNSAKTIFFFASNEFTYQQVQKELYSVLNRKITYERKSCKHPMYPLKIFRTNRIFRSGSFFEPKPTKISVTILVQPTFLQRQELILYAFHEENTSVDLCHIRNVQDKLIKVKQFFTKCHVMAVIGSAFTHLKK